MGERLDGKMQGKMDGVMGGRLDRGMGVVDGDRWTFKWRKGCEGIDGGTGE